MLKSGMIPSGYLQMLQVKEKYQHWLPQTLGVAAITIYPYILYSWGSAPTWLQVHEWTHINQVRRVGFVRFYLSYVLYYLAGRVEGKPGWMAYEDIPYEIEARISEGVWRSNGDR